MSDFPLNVSRLIMSSISITNELYTSFTLFVRISSFYKFDRYLSNIREDPRLQITRTGETRCIYMKFNQHTARISIT